jgi:cellulose synthase/poly-beta-1,6-N-acetylglucosamine synthase-like glycosyltransferase
VQLSLIVYYLKSSNLSLNEVKNVSLSDVEDQLPKVTIQLPIYNELYVVERLLDAVSKINYPKDLLEIQVLDDSTDETVEIIARKVQEIQQNGIDIQHIRRPERTGFKAGALAYGMTLAKGELIAIFDADFLPTPDFLENTIAFFQDSSIAVVQTRWLHLNEEYSLLTQLQAFGLDAHFTIEQKGRNAGNHFINFNGTAGIWRKTAIEDAGGWSADTLTEDLDLSYRAQMKGWKFKYLEEIGCPAELPVTINALKSQQYRWAKGAAECSKKNLTNLLTINTLKFTTKLHGFFHLMNSTVFVAILILAILSVPVLITTSQSGSYANIFRFTAVFQSSWLILGFFYWISYGRNSDNKSFLTFTKRFFLFLTLVMGLSLHNAIAVIEGWLGRKTSFIRTPKFNIKDKTDTWKTKKYLVKKIGITTFLEIALFLYCTFAIFLEFHYQNFGMLPFHTMLAIGLSMVIFHTFKEVN